MQDFLGFGQCVSFSSSYLQVDRNQISKILSNLCGKTAFLFISTVVNRRACRFSRTTFCKELPENKRKAKKHDLCKYKYTTVSGYYPQEMSSVFVNVSHLNASGQ